MISLSRIHETSINLRRSHLNEDNKLSRSAAVAKKLNRYSEMYPSGLVLNLSSAAASTTGVTCGDGSLLASHNKSSKDLSSINLQQRSSSKQLTSTTTITKHCISNPCAFQHINSLKDNDQHVKMLIDTFSFTSAGKSSGIDELNGKSKFSKSFFNTKKH